MKTISAVTAALIACSVLVDQASLFAQDTQSSISSGVAASAYDVTGTKESPPNAVSTSRNLQPSHDWVDRASLDLDVSYRRAFCGDIESQSYATLSARWFCSEFTSVGPYVSGGLVHPRNGSEADDVAHTPFFMEFGMVGRYQFTKQHVFLQPYLTASAGYAWMIWDYRETMTASDGGDVNTDTLDGFSAYAGVGLTVRMSRHLSLFGEFGSGGVALSNTTCSKVDNTFFQSFGYVGIKAGLSLTL